MRLASLAALVSVWLASAAHGATIYVAPGNRIADAMAAAGAGDTVLVGPGTYRERLQLVGKDIVLRGQMGADHTILDGSPVPGSIPAGDVLTLQAVTNAMIVEDLTITGGLSSTLGLGTGVYVNQGAPTIQRCRLVDNNATIGGGLIAYFFSRPIIRDCLVTGNRGGGIFIETDVGLISGPRAQIINTMVVRNFGFGVQVKKGGKADIENCTIAYNTADGVRGEEGNASIAIRRCIITNNGQAGIIRYDTAVCYSLECNDVYGNAAGSYLGVNLNDPCFTGRGDGDVSLDPVFRDVAGNDFRIAINSPLFLFCEGCGILGANNECTTSVAPSTWGAVKARYRD